MVGGHGNVPWALSDRKRKVRSVIYDQISTTWWKGGKIGQIDPEIICLKGFFFENEGGADDPFKLQSYWTEVHQIYTQCSQIITDHGNIALRFGMLRRRMKMSKIGYHGNVPWAIGKMGQIAIYDPIHTNNENLVKIGLVD